MIVRLFERADIPVFINASRSSSACGEFTKGSHKYSFETTHCQFGPSRSTLAILLLACHSRGERIHSFFVVASLGRAMQDDAGDVYPQTDDDWR
jgi:hypothetical protein